MAFTHVDYTIAWICALPLEMAAAKVMLDEVHPRLSQPPTDQNAYTLGKLSGHNVAIACLPSGVYGTTSAATVLAHMLPTFPSLQFGLMVGIGGGVPSEKVDIRLGDVVVSMPNASSGGVIQYDYGKTLSHGRLERTGVLNKPPICLLTAVSQVRSNYMIGEGFIEETISCISQRHRNIQDCFSQPDDDCLFKSTYNHVDEKGDCSKCDPQKKLDRVRRTNKEPRIHYGLIASGNQVMKDAMTRDFISQDLEILCFEMEAAGLMDQLPCLVIRGICDYCDSHKNKQWQGYAALTAAAYARNLLRDVPVRREKDLYEPGKSPLMLSEENRECLRSLGFREQNHRRHEIYSAKHTCKWLLEDPQYVAWMARSRGLLWIKGNPGTGKSVLMKFVVDTMAHINTQDLIVSFFINGRGTHLEKTPLGLFRALMNSMLDSFPRYLSQLTRIFEDREKRFGTYEASRWNWMEKELQDFMFQILTNETKDRPVHIFIDALDECGTNAARSLLSYFKYVMENVERQGGQVKICFSSRHYPILGLDTVPTIFVEERNGKDIRYVIHSLLSEIGPEDKRQELEEKILAKAQGGFQWAALVCDRVTKENTLGTKMQKLRQMVTLIPEALDHLYGNILSDISESERYQMIRLFQWVLFSERPLSAQELRDALSTSEDSKRPLKTHDSWSDTLTEFQRHVKNLSRGLVEFRTRDVWEQYEPGEEDSNWEAQFIHQSVADFLQNGFLYSMAQVLAQAHLGNGDYQISRSCLRYITLDEVLECTHLPRSKLCARFRLVPYVIQFLFHHVKKVEQAGIPQNDLLSLMQWENRTKLVKIGNLWKVLDPDSIHTPLGWPFIGATALHLIAAFGSKSALDGFLQRNDVQFDGSDADGNTSLMIAIRDGHHDIALHLLDSGQSLKVNAENNEGDTALHIALTDNAKDLIFKLIDAGADLKHPGHRVALVSFTIRSGNEILLRKMIEENVNLNGAVYLAVRELESGRKLETLLSILLNAGADASISPEFAEDIEDEDSELESEYVRDNHAICVASRRGEIAIVKLLLSHGFSPNEQNEGGESALLISIGNGHMAVVSTLLEGGADPESGDDSGQKPLNLALEIGDEPIISLLLQKGANPGSAGYSNQTLLFLAIRNGYSSIINLLLQKGVNLELVDDSGRTPLHLAVQNHREPIVSLLLQKGANIESTNNIGQTPLQTATRNGQEGAIGILLEQGANIESTDNIGQTPLYTAARNGQEGAIRILLEQGANIESTNNIGRTPLYTAARNGQEEAIRILLEQGANIESTDNIGQTPLHTAARNGQEGAIRILLEQGANIESTDNIGQTPLYTAARNGQEGAIRILLEQGANIELTNNIGRTPLHTAARNGQQGAIRILLEQGANIESTGNISQTPLHTAAGNGQQGAIRILLEQGANIESTDNISQTPLHTAAGNGQEGAIRILLEQGANIESTDNIGQTPLHTAAGNGQEGAIRILLEQDADIESTNNSGQTPLLLAIQKKQDTSSSIILQRGGNIHATDRSGQTPLTLAIHDRPQATVKMILQNGTHPDHADSSSRTPLFRAIECWRQAIIYDLLDQGANIEYRDGFGQTPLLLAAQNGNDRAVSILLEKGANPNSTDKSGRTPLLLAAQNGHQRVVNILIEKGANIK